MIGLILLYMLEQIIGIVVSLAVLVSEAMSRIQQQL